MVPHRRAPRPPQRPQVHERAGPKYGLPARRGPRPPVPLDLRLGSPPALRETLFPPPPKPAQFTGAGNRTRSGEAESTENRGKFWVVSARTSFAALAGWEGKQGKRERFITSEDLTFLLEFKTLSKCLPDEGFTHDFVLAFVGE